MLELSFILLSTRAQTDSNKIKIYEMREQLRKDDSNKLTYVLDETDPILIILGKHTNDEIFCDHPVQRILNCRDLSICLEAEVSCIA